MRWRRCWESSAGRIRLRRLQPDAEKRGRSVRGVQVPEEQSAEGSGDGGEQIYDVVADPAAALDGCAEQGVEDQAEAAGEEDDGTDGELMQGEAGNDGNE